MCQHLCMVPFGPNHYLHHALRSPGCPRFIYVFVLGCMRVCVLASNVVFHSVNVYKCDNLTGQLTWYLDVSFRCLICEYCGKAFGIIWSGYHHPHNKMHNNLWFLSTSIFWYNMFFYPENVLSNARLQSGQYCEKEGQPFLGDSGWLHLIAIMDDPIIFMLMFVVMLLILGWGVCFKEYEKTNFVVLIEIYLCSKTCYCTLKCIVRHLCITGISITIIINYMFIIYICAISFMLHRTDTDAGENGYHAGSKVRRFATSNIAPIE